MLLLFLILLLIIISVGSYYSQRADSILIKKLTAPVTFTALTTVLVLLLVLIWQINGGFDGPFINNLLFEFSVSLPAVGPGGQLHFEATFLGILLASFVTLSMVLFLLVSLGEKQTEEFVNYPLLLLLTASYLGLFLSHNLILFLIFWELVLVLTYFAGSGRGGWRQQNIFAEPAVFKLICSSFFLIFIIFVYHHTVDLTGESNLSLDFLSQISLASNSSNLLFWSVLFSFLPVSLIFPFHSLLTRERKHNFLKRLSFTILLPLSTIYILNQFLLPVAGRSSWFLVTIASFGTVYGAVLALRSKNYSSSIEWVALTGYSGAFAALFIYKPTAAAASILLALAVSLVLLVMILLDHLIQIKKEDNNQVGLQYLFTADLHLCVLFGLILFSMTGLVGSAFFPVYLMILGELVTVGWLPVLFLLTAQFILTVYCFKLLVEHFPLNSTISLPLRGIKPALYIALVLLILAGLIPGRFLNPLVEDVREYLELEKMEQYSQQIKIYEES